MKSSWELKEESSWSATCMFEHYCNLLWVNILMWTHNCIKCLTGSLLEEWLDRISSSRTLWKHFHKKSCPDWLSEVHLRWEIYERSDWRMCSRYKGIYRNNIDIKHINQFSFIYLFLCISVYARGVRILEKIICHKTFNLSELVFVRFFTHRIAEQLNF